MNDYRIRRIEAKLAAAPYPQDTLEKVLGELPVTLEVLKLFPEALASVRAALAEVVLRSMGPLSVWDTMPVVMGVLDRFPEPKALLLARVRAEAAANAAKIPRKAVMS